jgi:hypothetical protein
MKLSKALCTVPVIGFVAMAAFADDAAPPPAGGPMAACKQDVQTLCPGVQHGGGRIVACLKSHAADVSVGCKAAMKEAHARRGQQAAGSEPPASTPPGN